MDIQMYRITADYRPNNPNKPTYYVWGKNKRDAKKRFENVFSWLKIYNVELVNKEEAVEIEENPLRRPFNSPQNWEIVDKR